MGRRSRAPGPSPSQPDAYGARKDGRPYPRFDGGGVGEADDLTLGDWRRLPGIHVQEPHMFTTDYGDSEGNAAVLISGILI